MGETNSTSCSECELSCVQSSSTREDLLLMEENRSEMQFAPGETIIRQGSFVAQIIYLKQGVIKIVLESKNNRNTILKLVNNEQFIALPVLGNPDKYPFSVIAITDCKVCFIKKEAILTIMGRNIAINNFLLKWFTNDYLFMYNKIATSATRNSHGKLASTLLYLTNGTFNADVLNLISRKELAELACISVESTNKILMQLKHDGLIDIDKNHRIQIKRFDLITKLSTSG